MHIRTMTIKEDHRTVANGVHVTALAAAGILGAVAASSCCLLPLVLVSVGVSGAWISNLTALAPYQSYIALITLTALGCGFYSVYLRAPQRCEDDTCERPLPRPAVKAGLWFGALLIVSALIFPRIAAMLGGI
jgi:mercuric ion transport protein